MIGTTILTLVVFSLVYPVLTKERITRGRAIWLVKQQKRKEHLKQWKPVGKDSELVISKTGVSMKGGWRSKRKLRYELKDKKAKMIGKVCVSLVVVVLLSYILSSPLILFGIGAAFTSKASGDWDAAGQTTWNEINAPVSTDTVQINNTHVVRIDNGTGNEACLSIDIQSGGTLTIGDENIAAISLTFDDNAAAGFINTSAGTLNCVGTDGNGVTITSAVTPPTNHWNAQFPSDSLDITMDYTTWEYYDDMALNTDGTIDVDNCTFQNIKIGLFVRSVALLESTILSFTNNTINCDAGAKQRNGIWTTLNITGLDNITITGEPTQSIEVGGAKKVELANSSFDITTVNVTGLGLLVSDNHDDVAGAWNAVIGSAAWNKSVIINDFISSDNVTIYEGELICDEATAHNDLTIKDGGTLNVSPNVTQTVTNTGTITCESGGTIDWTGTDGNLIILVSDAGGTQWSLDAQNGSTVNVSFVDVTDSDASGGDQIDASDGTNIGLGQNNDNWFFGAGGVPSQPALAFWLT